jgi:hypothetical protein
MCNLDLLNACLADIDLITLPTSRLALWNCTCDSVIYGSLCLWVLRIIGNVCRNVPELSVFSAMRYCARVCVCVCVVMRGLVWCSWG